MGRAQRNPSIAVTAMGFAELYPSYKKSRTRRSHPAFNISVRDLRLLPLRHIDVIAAGDAGVELARTADLLLRVLDHLAPLADPADGAGDREQHGEHRGREAHRLQRDARIEIDVRVELAVDEVLIGERNLFQLQRHL